MSANSHTAPLSQLLHPPSLHNYGLLFWLLIVVVLGLVTYTVFNLPQRDTEGNAIPKGPRGLPILGSYPFLTRYPEQALHHWAQEYGSLYSLWIGNQLFIVISDAHVAKDIMVMQGKIFSSRKESFIKGQTIFVCRGVVSTPYGDKWRKHRRMANQWLTPRAVDSHALAMDRESRLLLKAMLDESRGGLLPVDPHPYAGRCAFNVMATIAFGSPLDDRLVMRGLELSREFMNCTGPMSNLVDFVPILQWMPSQMHRRAKRLHRKLVQEYGKLVDNIEQKLARSSDVPKSLSKEMLESRGKEGLDELDIKILASAFMIGGVETTAAIIQWFSAVLLAYPHIQAKAQSELDRVVGRNRLPTLSDEKNLPYVRAIIKEVERMYNPLWLGTPHLSTEDYTYKGNFIPKDSIIVLNTWTIHHDERRYKHAREFMPERYLGDTLSSAESANVSDPMQRDHWMFGIGRRICPGITVAEREIFLVVSRMLWSFTLHDIPGEPIDLTQYDGLSGRSPAKFRMRLEPRFESVTKILTGLA